ncbi:hypothetical protein ACFSYB_07965 [Litchfieldia salsa]
MVALYESEKSRKDIVREYELTASALDRWIVQFQESGSFQERLTEVQKNKNLLILKKK